MMDGMENRRVEKVVNDIIIALAGFHSNGELAFDGLVFAVSVLKLFKEQYELEEGKEAASHGRQEKGQEAKG
jgi:hypothetical protein